MSGSDLHVNLVTFASRFEHSQVGEALCELGCHLHVIPGDRWLTSTSRVECPLILVIGKQPGKQFDLSLVRDKLLNTQSLIIFLGEISYWLCVNIPATADFILWPDQEGELELRIRRLTQYVTSSFSAPTLDVKETDFIFRNLVGSSPAFTSSLRAILRLARIDVPVLIEGETGTGKEHAARAIHYLGGRADQPFVPVNCGAIPEGLIENEFFGHERGAYTDAREASPGAVEQAEGGTLFLDEVNTLALKAQSTLLRFLDAHQYKPVGGKREKSADVRIIAATNENLHDLVETREFRADLMFRLDILKLTLPPLRSRRSDVRKLAEHYLRKYAAQYHLPELTLTKGMIAWMEEYDWPGNVRELQNFLLRQIVFDDIEITKSLQRTEEVDATTCIDDTSPFEESFNEAKAKVMERFEIAYLADVLKRSQGNVTHAARFAGKERRALGKLLKKHNINRRNYVAG